MVEFKKVAFGGWPNCYQVSNGKVELVITGDVGPRIIRFGFVGGANQFCEVDDMLGKTGGDEWRIYGGHRFWYAPEDPVRTYLPDNSLIIVKDKGDFIQVTQPVEPQTGLQKQMDIRMDATEAKVEVTHRLINTGLFALETCPWALSVMAIGGVSILPLPPRGSHPEDLLPVNNLVQWSYNDLSDPRWTWGHEFILLRQDVNGLPQKIGASTTEHWLAYVNGGTMFVKQYPEHEGAIYPDFGSQVELFSCDFMLELETLAPLDVIEPGEIAEHTEVWHLFADVPTVNSEADVKAHVLPRVEAL